MRRLSRWRRRDDAGAEDQGAVAILVALLLTGGVLLGTAALVIDVGNLYAKRDQLQNGADAAAWAVAQSCIADPGTCTNPDQLDTVQALSQGQSYGADGSPEVGAQVCIDDIDCAVWNTEVRCPANPLAFGASAEVRAYYQRDGDLLMPAPLAGIFTGQDKSTRVGACARVAWGQAESMRVSGLGVAIDCLTTDFFGVPGIPATTQQDIGATPRRLPAPTASADRDLGTCGFAWLDSADCLITLAPPLAVTTVPGPAQACLDMLDRAATGHEPMLVGVYEIDPITTETVVRGYAALAVTGFAGQGATADQVSWLSGTQCASPCVSGYFTQMLALTARPKFTTQRVEDFGVTAIGRTG